MATKEQKVTSGGYSDLTTGRTAARRLGRGRRAVSNFIESEIGHKYYYESR